VVYSPDGSNVSKADAAIVVVGEVPYAEFMGDRASLNLPDEDLAAIERVKRAGIPTIVLMFSGRPIIINRALELSDAFVAAWLPGTEGRGVTDVLFGDFPFKGKLSFSWPQSMEQIPINVGDSNYQPLFKYGFGLQY